MKTNRSARGFTLVEIMITVTLMGFIMAGVMTFYLQNVRSMYASEQRLKLAGEIKRFSNELVVQASRSNQFVLFKSARAVDFDGTGGPNDTNDTVRQIIDIDNPTNPLHPAGDFVVFIYYEIPKPAAQPFHRITKLEGYYLNAINAGTLGALRKIVIDLSGAPSTNTVEAILKANWSTAQFTTYFPNARGLAVPEVIDGVPTNNAASARLFYMSDARNVIISGQIYSSNKEVTTGDFKTYTNTFSFNVTPRT